MAPTIIGRSTGLLSATCLALLVACSNVATRENSGTETTESEGVEAPAAAGEPAEEAATAVPELRFYLVAYRSDRMRLFWHEWPHYADNRLTLGTPLDDCRKQTLYAYAVEAAPERVSHKGTAVTPLRLRNTAEEMAAWDRLPSGYCSAMITAGYWIEDAFTGLSLSTRDGVFRRVSARMPMEPGDAGASLGNLKGIKDWLEQSFPEEWAGREVTVSFDFPRGRHTEVTLSLMGAASTLDGPYYQTADWQNEQPWNTVRFWARAALARLELDFREQAESETGDVQSTVLTSVEGVRGAWWFDTQDGRDVTSALGTPLNGARHIRFQVE